MERVIKGRKYNTRTADFVAEIVDRGGDFEHENTCMYRTAKGVFFLAGYGGGSTRWRQLARDGGGYIPGDGILPLTDDEARALLEAHANKLVERYFTVEDA